jgi:hypothetical protein
MPKSENIKKFKKSPQASNKPLVVPPKKGWISMKSGLWIITAASIVMGVLTVTQVAPSNGLLQGVIYGVIFAGMVWVVFLVSQVFFRFLR